MSRKDPPPSKEDRLAKALRDNLARRKALLRAKRARKSAEDTTPPLPPAGKAERDDASS